nr:unnamed protein product [Callosobruchus analis]
MTLLIIHYHRSLSLVSSMKSPLLVQSGRVTKDLMHITDWLPTLYSAANGDIANLDPEMDGIDQWPSLTSWMKHFHCR